MKKSAKNSPPPAVHPVDWAALFPLQKASGVEELVRALDRALAAQWPLQSLRLVYRAATGFESLTVRAGQLEREGLSRFRFEPAGPGTVCRRRGRRLVVAECDEQAQLWLEVLGESEPPPKRLPDELVQFAFGQLRLLLRLRQQEVNAVRDDLTSAFNQNFLKKFINDEIARCRRHPAPFAVVFIDLDNLKDINDRHCHLVGSQVLKEVAEVFIRTVRQTDLVARFGGDEFVVVLQHTELPQAMDICRRIRERLNAARLCRDQGLDIRVTASYGISAMSERVSTAEDIIREADQAMFAVKNGSKNAIQIFQGD